MKYRQLGQAGVKVSAIGLGSYLTIGMSLDDPTAAATVRKAYDLGVNFFDTANAYNEGRAEMTLARIISQFPRSSLAIATKVYAPMGEGPNDRGLSAKHIREQCEASLGRLGLDYVDLYQCHRPDGSVPIEETCLAMEDLCRAGKILYWGTSEWPAWLIATAMETCQRHGWHRPVSNQPRYSLLYRQPEAELFQFCGCAGVGNVVFSPLAHGMLTGKYLPGAPPPPGTRAADPDQNGVIMRMYWNETNLQKCRQFREIAGGLGVQASQLALAWVLRRPEVSSAIIGASKVSQVEENVTAADLTIPADALKKLDELFPGPKVTYPL